MEIQRGEANLEVAAEVERPEHREEKRPSKRYYGSFLTLGIAALLPYNCMIVPVDYWSQFYPQIFMSVLSFTYSLVGLAVVGLMIWRGYKLNYNIHIYSALAFWFFALVFIPLCYLLTKNKTVLMWITLVPIVMSGIGNGTYYSTLVGYASKLNPLYAQAISAGQGVAGLIPQLILILIKGIVQAIGLSQEDYEAQLYYSTLAYFAVGAAFILASIFVWKRVEAKTRLEVQKADVEVAVSRKMIVVGNEPGFNTKSVWEIFTKMRVPAVAVFLNFLFTMSIFPQITMFVPFNTYATRGKYGQDKAWWSVGFMTCFMVFDYVGRSLAGFRHFSERWTLKGCLIYTISRVVFFALFLMEAMPAYECDDFNVCTRGPVIKSDVVSMITMTLFAFTNGYNASLIMMKYSSVLDADEQDRGSNIQTFMLYLGLTTGAAVGLGISKLMS